MVVCMKTTVEISERLLDRVQAVMRREKLTLRALIEEGLSKVVEDRSKLKNPFKLRDASVDGEGLSAGFAEGGWDRIRDEIYPTQPHR